MIFAEIQYDIHYSDFHAELISFIEANFPNVESGLQGDSWVWITEGSEKLAIDTFTSMRHQIKSSIKDGSLVPKVIEILKSKYQVTIYEIPEYESHE
jgi:hypothetical protein